MDWQVWQDAYDNPDSALARRLRAVQARIRDALDDAPPGPLRVVSLCAGQGRDLLEVLAEHPRRADVRARLVELDERNADCARETIRAFGLHQVEMVTGDASLTDHYQGMTPADLVLVCGLFGNITDPDIERVIDTCPQLCATGGIVVWTRHRKPPDRVPLICDRFERRGFELQWLSDPDAGFGLGAHRFAGTPEPLVAGQHMFRFVGYDRLRVGEAQGAQRPDLER
ncbi:class I SAM-dependent methyltransferase family protein [Phenylobacterium aquaticum]|uniref:class I SAM-dependent methyltransferase family protein n=1 Tax=Phenylobacterium aquaticum TaxID=1763816 RepID=UPI001F5CE005|nr:class I SAM-dependent methyltransferase family protein [Phenylobacterium aquaticum]MCI3132076.1 class I SAM-dependent methyltransferase family protein [Phenylobacterium aquaticum]